jgi:hypothetical protein
LDYLPGAPINGRLQALFTNIILGWKGLPGTNSLAYLKIFKLCKKKRFITLVPGGFEERDGEIGGREEEV